MIKYKVVFNTDNGLKWYPNEDELLEICGYELEEGLYFDTIPSKEKVMELFGKFKQGYKDFVSDLKTLKIYDNADDLYESELELFSYDIYELTYTEETDDLFDYDLREKIIIFE